VKRRRRSLHNYYRPVLKKTIDLQKCSFEEFGLARERRKKSEIDEVEGGKMIFYHG